MCGHRTARSLVYGLMLISGNDAAVAIACVVDGGTEAFAAHMNSRAKELGLSDTHFVTPNGLHDPDHYTTAKDLATLGAYALGNTEFAEIVSTRYRKTEGSLLHTLKNKRRIARADYEKNLKNMIESSSILKKYLL